MPPRLALSTRALSKTTREPYVCACCLLQTKRAPKPAWTSSDNAYSTLQITSRSPVKRPAQSLVANKHARTDKQFKRHASNGSLASKTATNAPSTVPRAYRELYQRLLALQESASSYVDLSRLQLALRTLESSAPTIRIALLGLGNNGIEAAKKLVTVLLSDALSEEEAFERDILETGSDGRALLLRYGDPEDATPTNPLVRTMNIPSRFLERHNVELLVTSFNNSLDSTSMEDLAALEEAILVPSLTTANSEEGRVGFVRFPVHKAVIVADGISGAIQYGRLPSGLAEGDLITAALNVPIRSNSKEANASSEAVDIDLASHALSLFRENKANGARFSEEWQSSHLPRLSSWIVGSRSDRSESGLQTAVYNLISSILTRASTSISVSQDAEQALTLAKTVPEARRLDLQTAITSWYVDAHRDLQNNLDTAFGDSSTWRRTVWWRLFWRIDDVTLSASNILRNSWLTEAEQQLAFLSGRIFNTGLATQEQLTGPTPALLDPGRKEEMEERETSENKTETVAELMRMPSMISRMQQRYGVNALFNPPWPQNINLSRQFMLHTLVPDLHRKAQALLATTLTTFGGSAALSAWFFVATAGIGIYESGAIVALGLVWSLRRLQKKWSIERESFAVAVREDARRVLTEVEGHLRRVVHDGGKASVRAEDVKMWAEAREAIETCEQALQKLQTKV